MPQSLPGPSVRGIDVSTGPSDDHDLVAACASLGLIGRSPAFRAVLDLLPQFAACDAPVLLRGETGTGKELIARALHYLSPRRAKPFVPVNCGALPEQLLESELFGHVRGAFTDARLDQPGLVAMAENGTLFLDEVDSLSAKGQVALLRFLQDHEYRQVGGQNVRTAHVRVLSATNSDLAAQVADRRFRQDLLFRLDVLTLELPPLARRLEDIPLLARHFLTRFAALYGRPAPLLDADFATCLVARSWPGNVRELENTMHRAFLLADGGRIESPPAPEPEPAPDVALYGGGLRQTCAAARREAEQRYLRDLIATTAGNVSEAARRAGVERRAMGRMLKRHGIKGGESGQDRSGA